MTKVELTAVVPRRTACTRLRDSEDAGLPGTVPESRDYSLLTIAGQGVVSRRFGAMNPILGISMASSLLSALSRVAGTQHGPQVAATPTATGADGSATTTMKDASGRVVSAATTAVRHPGRALNILV
jgi:hypothetical protein